MVIHGDPCVWVSIMNYNIISCKLLLGSVIEKEVPWLNHFDNLVDHRRSACATVFWVKGVQSCNMGKVKVCFSCLENLESAFLDFLNWYSRGSTINGHDTYVKECMQAIYIIYIYIYIYIYYNQCVIEDFFVGGVKQLIT